ncbi:hypothetical protein AN189_02820 [Loktanella sp. 3ANDIMAR09]|uniref:phage tail protein I n=1 Tax=Loktanella sp. 3ANDIMAR09 TaxID=1225657 RepID=UPI000700AF6D|nr:phage tail protein I [Loktanella sp. 3ANDIMAR09]KQI69376.1 hypothetical protein AN189_02820 [Loktanella sp. 3ANDIMAR09]
MSDDVAELIRTLVPSSIRDPRQDAFLAAFGATFADFDLTNLVMVDAQTCPVELLPALIVEFSLEEYVTSDLSEQRVRDIISNAYELHVSKGYDAGVVLALSLVGVTAEIVHWYEDTPVGPPNTHRLVFEADGEFWSDEPIGGPRAFDRIRTLVEASKRFSQDTAYQVRSTNAQTASAATGMRARLDATGILRPDVPVTDHSVSQPAYIAARGRIVQRGDVRPA